MKHYRKSRNVMATNRKARHDYFVLDTYEAGLELKGEEIKSIRNHQISLKDGFVRIRNNEAYLENVHISPYFNEGAFSQWTPRRDRKLLLHKREIKRLFRAVQHQGITIIPLKVYIKHGLAKVLIGVAKGKHEWDKRRAIKDRDTKRAVSRYLKNY